MIELQVVQPFPWQQLLHYLSFRLVPEFESVENNHYQRVCRDGLVRVTYDEARSLLQIKSDLPEDRLDDVVIRVSRIFRPQLCTEIIYQQLVPHLPALAKTMGFRPLGCWDPFELCLRTIIGQQVTVAAANTIMRRLIERCGKLIPEAVIAADLTDMGMPGARVTTLVTLATAIAEGELDLSMPWPELRDTLIKLRGIGPWTCGYLAIRLGMDEDAFPETDVGLIRSAKAESAKALLASAEQWRPYRAYAAVGLWAID
jgi:3-methyladenine DNA glycosylase/8-oxoguanine DNA glycosylase|tara:strand:- start:157 stop:930 length:774 start_codon:yes stop_codon:yes gene_type:complete